MSRTPIKTLLLVWLLFAGTSVWAQHLPVPDGRASRYGLPASLDYEALVPGPPAPGSAEDLRDLEAVLRAQRTRTPAEVEAARRDDQEEDIFVFRDVAGARFVPEKLPLTVSLSRHLREESAVVNPGLKLAFHRARPFVAHPEVHPVCQRTPTNSYPSGHTMVGFLEAFALAQMLPELSGAIWRRADEYAWNRTVCGSHYPSDLAASKRLSAALFGALSTSPRFQKELAAAREETRRQLLLP